MSKKRIGEVMTFDINPFNVNVLEGVFALIQNDPLFPIMKTTFEKVVMTKDAGEVDELVDSRIVTYLNLLEGYLAENFGLPGEEEFKGRPRRDAAEEIFGAAVRHDRTLIDNIRALLKSQTC